MVWYTLYVMLVTIMYVCYVVVPTFSPVNTNQYLHSPEREEP